jgi:hypothetical protein
MAHRVLAEADIENPCRPSSFPRPTYATLATVRYRARAVLRGRVACHSPEKSGEESVDSSPFVALLLDRIAFPLRTATSERRSPVQACPSAPSMLRPVCRLTDSLAAISSKALTHAPKMADHTGSIAPPRTEGALGCQRSVLACSMCVGRFGMSRRDAQCPALAPHLRSQFDGSGRVVTFSSRFCLTTVFGWKLHGRSRVPKPGLTRSWRKRGR